ncbi:hypothetical protein Q3C01_32955 [Bradyrhizobium sp. UFLA05-109]
MTEFDIGWISRERPAHAVSSASRLPDLTVTETNPVVVAPKAGLIASLTRPGDNLTGITLGSNS